MGGDRMIFKNVTAEELTQALDIVNKKFDNNVTFYMHRESKNAIRMCLRVIDSHKKGAKLGFSGRHTINACWHVHGYYFEALLSINPKAVIKTVISTITLDGGNWTDKNIGSLFNPLMYSEACECEY